MRLISLGLLGYSKYKIDYNGNIYRFIFNKTRYEINEFICNNIKDKYKNQKCDYITLSKEFNIPISKIQKIISLEKEKYWILMKHTLDSKGYVSIKLYNKKGFQCFKLHTIICSIFYGPCPQGMECRHLDGNRANYHPDNLIWGTLKENQADRILHGTSNRGERCGQSKLTEFKIKMIRYHSKYLNNVQLSKIYNVSSNHIGMIIRRKVWKHI